MSKDKSAARLVFKTKGGAEWELSLEEAVSWAPVYPALDVVLELRKASMWLDANRTRRKTTRGMLRFITAWLNRAVKDAARRPVRKGSGFPSFALATWRCYHMDECDHRQMCEHKNRMGAERYPVHP